MGKQTTAGQYQLKAGKWVPKLHLEEYKAGSLEISELLAPEGVELDTEEQARHYSEGMAKKWLNGKIL